MGKYREIKMTGITMPLTSLALDLENFKHLIFVAQSLHENFKHLIFVAQILHEDFPHFVRLVTNIQLRML
jgi:hypothetical protein